MERSELDGLLGQIPILQFLPPDVRELVEASFVSARYTFGQEIVREGEPADALYVLVSGRARVLKRAEGGDEISLGGVRPGETFGEGDLLNPGIRATTVRASSDVEVLRLDQSVVDALIRRRPEIRQYLELQARHRHLQGFFRQFSVFDSLPPDATAALLAALEPVEVPANTAIIRDGEPPGPMYILEDGRCRVHIGVDGRRRNVAYLRKGEFFGELSVFRNQPREATVESVTPCRLLRLTQQTYRDLLDRYPGFKEAIEERIAQYNFRHTAQIPIDLFREILPADASVTEKVGADQVDEDVTAPSRPGLPGEEEAPFSDGAGRFVKRRRRIRSTSPRIPPVGCASFPLRGPTPGRGCRPRRTALPSGYPPSARWPEGASAPDWPARPLPPGPPGRVHWHPGKWPAGWRRRARCAPVDGSAPD